MSGAHAGPSVRGRLGVAASVAGLCALTLSGALILFTSLPLRLVLASAGPIGFTAEGVHGSLVRGYWISRLAYAPPLATSSNPLEAISQTTMPVDSLSGDDGESEAAIETPRLVSASSPQFRLAFEGVRFRATVSVSEFLRLPLRFAFGTSIGSFGPEIVLTRFSAQSMRIEADDASILVDAENLASGDFALSSHGEESPKFVWRVRAPRLQIEEADLGTSKVSRLSLDNLAWSGSTADRFYLDSAEAASAQTGLDDGLLSRSAEARTPAAETEPRPLADWLRAIVTKKSP